MGKDLVTRQLDNWQLWSVVTDCFGVANTELSFKALEDLMRLASLKLSGYSKTLLLNAGFIQRANPQACHRNAVYKLIVPCPMRYDDRLDRLPKELEHDIRKMSPVKGKSLDEMLHEPTPTTTQKEQEIPSYLIPKREYEMRQELDALKEQVHALTEQLQQQQELIMEMSKSVIKLNLTRKAFADLVASLQ